MMVTSRARRKRPKRRLTACSQPDDEVDDPNYPEFLWIPLAAVNLLLLLISMGVRLLSQTLGDIFRVLYGVVCVLIFALTTSYFAQEARKHMNSRSRNKHVYRKMAFGETLRRVLFFTVFMWVLYAPAVVIPAFIFRARWLIYINVLIIVVTVAIGLSEIVAWLRYRKADPS